MVGIGKDCEGKAAGCFLEPLGFQKAGATRNEAKQSLGFVWWYKKILNWSITQG